MSTWTIDEQQLLELNTFLQRVDDVIVHNCVTRTAQESKLFPLMPYLDLCMIDSYYKTPEVIRESLEFISPEQCGHRAREVTTNLSKLTAWGTLNFYLNGRSFLIRLGLLRPEDNLEDLWLVCDWWQRFSRAYHRNSGHVWTYDADDIAPEHSERVLQVFEADAYGADERLRNAASRFIAAGTQYSFLANCESRVSLHAAGPYRLGNNILMHTRDFMNLAECDYSWLDGVAEGVPYNNLTLVVITKDVSIEITDWASTYTDPEDYQSQIIGVGLYTSDFLSDVYTPVGMESATELAETLEVMTESVSEATSRLYMKFSGMSARQMVDAGIFTYVQCAADIAHMAGTYRQSEWEFIDERTERLRPVFNEEYSLDAYVDNWMLMNGYQGSQHDYYLHPVPYRNWRRSQTRGPIPRTGRNGFLVPSHVLIDHDYPNRANPNGKADWAGTSSLPAKSTPYTTSQGKLTEAELNEAARAFSSPLLEAPQVYYDDQWVKWNSDSPKAAKLYEYVQRNSRLLTGRGARLTRGDLEVIRARAGEPLWRELAGDSNG